MTTIDLDASRKVAREAQDLAAIVLTKWRSEIERLNERVRISPKALELAEGMRRVQNEAAKLRAWAHRLSGERDEARARVERFEAFLPKVGYDPNDV